MTDNNGAMSPETLARIDDVYGAAFWAFSLFIAYIMCKWFILMAQLITMLAMWWP